MLKKIISITLAAVCGIAVYFVFFAGGSAVPFERTDLGVKTTLKADQYPVDEDPSGQYLRVGDENITLKTNIIRIDGQKNIKINTTLNGELKIYFNVKKLSEESKIFSLEIINTADNNKPLKKITTFPRIVTVNETFTKKGDGPILLRFKGKADIAVSEPLIYQARTEKKGDYIFLISADTLRADHLGAYGYTKNVSPNIDAFAKDAVVFDHCFANASWTLPSHMTLFTGMDVHTLGLFSKFSKLPKGFRLLTELMLGRYPVISYNGGVFIAAKYGFYKGFDFYKTIMFPPPSDVLFKAAVRYLETTKFPRLFAFLHTYQTHAPYNLHGSLPHSERMRKKGIETAVKDFFRVLPNRMLGGTPFIYKPLDDSMRENIVNVYDGDVEFLDHWFGYFLKELKRMGIYERSMIIFLSDHGEEFFDHGGWDHGHSLYNEQIHVPLIIKFPDEKYKGTRIADNVSLKDVFPTLLDYLGVEPGERLDGNSFMPLVTKDGKTRKSRSIISVLKRRKARFTPEKVAIIKENFKLIYNHPYSEELLEYFGENPPPAYTEYELYDLDKDFAEKNNLVGDKKHMNTFRAMKTDIQLILKLIKKREKSPTERVKISPEEMERLKSLGYL